MQQRRGWREIIVGVVILLFSWTASWLVNDFITLHAKISQYPDPSAIATTRNVDDRFSDINIKIDGKFQENNKRLDRIEDKVDTLIMGMALQKKTHQSILNKLNDPPEDSSSPESKIVQVPKSR